MGFGDYAAKRLLLAIPVLLGVSVGVFLLIKLSPGDVVSAILPPQQRTPENIQRLQDRLGLGQPLYIQYFEWLKHALQGDLGQSYALNNQVTELILDRVWPTAQLAIVSLLIAMLIAVPAGLLSAVYKDTWIDHGSRIFAFLGISIPPFWLGIMLIMVFVLFWKGWFGAPLLPISGYVAPTEQPVQWAKSIIAPGITLGVGYAALTARMTRSAMVEVMNEDYVQTARSKGVKESVVMLVHTFRNALIPVVTVLGLQIGFLFNGSIVVEQIFKWPGIGRLLYNAVLNRDLPLIQGIILFVAMVFVLANLFVDLLYAYLDPRIKYEG
ncbi:ABC transporter permease [Halorussus salinisoli]|uniref:ABC transporter permease n=1 Tax=Halorussus salinisoli TaxID=2558242 RepID=UPI0010C164D6|nr:ABC transporter permease [Halorussus salinisoli]